MVRVIYHPNDPLPLCGSDGWWLSRPDPLPCVRAFNMHIHLPLAAIARPSPTHHSVIILLNPNVPNQEPIACDYCDGDLSGQRAAGGTWAGRSWIGRGIVHGWGWALRCEQCLRNTSEYHRSHYIGTSTSLKKK